MTTERTRTRILRIGMAAAALVLLAVTRPGTSGQEAASAGALAGPIETAGASDSPRPTRAASIPITGREIVVGTGGDAPTITRALEMAEDGDRIVVRAGTYTDTPIQIGTSIELIGEDFPVLDGEGRGSVLIVTAPQVTVRGFVIRNTGVSHTRSHAGIRLERARDCLVEGNRLEDTFLGIYLAQADGCVVRGNELRASGERETTSGNGIHLWNVEGALIDGNRIEGHRDGIYLESARGATIRHNRSVDNLRYGLHFMFSDDSVYENNTFKRNAAGVAVMYSRHVRMTGNRFEQNWGTAAYGLLLKEVVDSRIENNLFRQNTTAILADGANRLVFQHNRIERNGWALRIHANSLDNHFLDNDFVENTFEVVTNSRRSFNTFDRNYWSRYQGYDLVGDGFGDIPHRPVRLFSFMVETHPVAIILLRSFFVDLLDVAERVLPVLTPEALIDERPRMRPTAT